jgi:thiol-disulfide isomerase/thioredoxin
MTNLLRTSRRVLPFAVLVPALVCTTLPQSASAQGRQASVIGLSVFVDPDFRGESASFRDDMPDLRAVRLNDEITSIQVPRGEAWEVCQDINFQGRCRVFVNDEPDLRQVGWNDTISSIRLVRGRGGFAQNGDRPRGLIELFAAPRFNGASRSFNEGIPNLAAVGFNDQARSLRLAPSETWEVCADANYRNCRVVETSTPDLGELGMSTRISSVRPVGRNDRDSRQRSNDRVARRRVGLVLYDERGYRGQSLLVADASGDLGRFGGRAESVEGFSGTMHAAIRRHDRPGTPRARQQREVGSTCPNDFASMRRPRPSALAGAILATALAPGATLCNHASRRGASSRRFVSPAAGTGPNLRGPSTTIRRGRVMNRALSVLLCLLALVASPGGASAQNAAGNVVSATRAAISAGDIAAGEALVTEYRATNGVTSEMLEALSWLGRGALAADDLASANRYAREAHELSLAALETRKLDDDRRLQTALGAAIEVEALVRAERGERSNAVYYLSQEVQRYRGTSIEKRLMKNLNLLSLTGQPAPALEATEYLGRPLPTPAELKGRPVVLFFWAHWCPDCKAQSPILEKVLDKYRAQGLAVVAPTQRFGYTATNRSPTPVEELGYIEQIRDQYYAFLRSESVPVSEANHRLYGVSSTPTLVLVDREGLVQLYHPGQMTEQELDSSVAALLAASTGGSH